MQYTYSDPLIAITDLQIFADGGGAGAGGGDGAGTTGGTAAVAGQQGRSISAILAGGKTGQNDATRSASATQAAETAADPDAEFEALIKGQYKQQFDKRMQSAIKDRLKSSKAELESSKADLDRYKKLGPTLVSLGTLYGVDPEDFDAINEAVQKDDRYFEDAALEKGMDVASFREFESMKHQLAEKERAEAENSARMQAERDLQGWIAEADAIKDIIPGLDLRQELANPDMVKLLQMHIPLQTAYVAVHGREFIPQALRNAAADGAQQATNAVMAGASRPREGGAGGAPGSITSADVRNMTRAQREDLIRRAQAGERITL